MKKGLVAITAVIVTGMSGLALAQAGQREPNPGLTPDQVVARKCLGVQHWSMVKCVQEEKSRINALEDKDSAITTKDSLERGETIFHQYCYVCHGSEGKGNGSSAKYVGRPVYDLTQPIVQEKTDNELMERITNGISPMPEFKDNFFSKDDLSKVIKYIRTLSTNKNEAK